MSPDTKAQAQAKLAKFTVKIGYPDKWRDYSALADQAGTTLVGNAKRAVQFALRPTTSTQLGKPVDRTRGA